jgi:hypothetical protein
MVQTEVFLTVTFVTYAILAYVIYAFTWSIKTKGILFVATLVFDALLFPLNVRSLLAGYIGYDLDMRICRMAGTCPPLPALSSGLPVELVDLVQVCKMGLNPRHDGWSTGYEFRNYAAEAARRQKSIDDCRGVLGLRTLREEEAELARIEEERRLRSLDQARLCNEAIDEADGEWDLTDAARRAVREAQARRLSRDACLIALGWSIPGLEVDAYVEARDPAPPAPEFPTGYIRNAKASFANLRESPGANARVVTQLANGTEVVILGTRPSPTSGHAYCRVLTRDGVPGYVDHQLVDRTCVLDSRQSSYLLDVEGQERMEAFKLFRDIAVIGLGLALKR